MSNHEKIQKQESKRNFLTLDEVRQLENTPYEKEVIQQVFLFACYCGMHTNDLVFALPFYTPIREHVRKWTEQARLDKHLHF